jgi:DNA-binding LacI/PurR family transcriptional regulator
MAARERPTVRDVAAVAGVSLTTVSHALNGKGRVDARTRERVLDAAKRIGYRANPTARSLRSGRTGILALVLPMIGSDGHRNEALGLDFYIRLAGAAAGAAAARDHALLLPPPLRQIADVRGLPVDGAIVVDPGAHDPVLALFDALGLPVVTVERDPARPGADWFVASDNARNTRTVLHHLAANGARRIALLAPQTTASWVSETRETYAAWTAEHAREPIVVSVPHERLEGSAYTSTLALLDRPDRPDAVYAVSEPYATGALRAARERGLRVPGDLLLVAGVDSHEASAGDPPITALDLHPDEQAAVAVELLVARVAGRDADVPRTVPGTLCIRRSTTAIACSEVDS